MSSSRITWPAVCRRAGFTVGSAVLLGGLVLSGLFEKPEFLTRDWRFRVREVLDRDHEFDPRVRVVGITDADLHVLGRWPWRRDFHGEMVSLLHGAGADAIAFDLLFIEPSGDKDSDDHFAAAVSEAQGRVVLGAEKIVRSGMGADELPDALPNVSGKMPDADGSDATVLLPYPPLGTAGEIGFVNADADSDGGRRELPLVEFFNAACYPSLATRVLMVYWNLDPGDIEVRLGREIVFHTEEGARSVPIDREGKMIVNLRSPERFLEEGVVSYVQLYQALESHVSAGKPWDSATDLHPAGRIFVIGQVAPGLSDMGPTAFQPLTPLCYLQAQAVSNILQQYFVKRASLPWSLVGWSIVTFLLLVRLRRASLKASLIVPLAAVSAYIAVAVLLFAFHSILLPIVWPVVGYTGLQFATVMRSWQREREARIATDASLHAAAEIQLSTLPEVSDLGEEIRDFDLAARLIPAQDASGDFYDFFMVDETHLCVVVADVCDKGITAATFMLQAKTLLKALAHEAGRSGLNSATPGKIFIQANRELAERNAKCMFATAFLGLYDTKTGRLDYSTAGHQPPLLRAGSGSVSELDGTGDLALGLIGQMPYHTLSHDLNPGDAVFAYTDGITEAFDHRGGMYGLERLLETLGGEHGKSGEAILSATIRSVQDFTFRAEQSDDVTALVLMRTENSSTNNSG